MKKLLNTLYITNPDAYLSKYNDNIVVSIDGKEVGAFPIHIFRQIVCFNYTGLSPALMKLAMEKNINITFFTPYGNFCGRVVGKSYGNIYVRKKQYKLCDGEQSLEFVRNIIYAKAYNSKKVLIRSKNDHKDKIDVVRIEKAIDNINSSMQELKIAQNKDSIRGIEGNIAREYFSVLDELILKQREDFYMVERSKRPPKDRFNALISFMYSVYTNEIAAALEGVGIDSYAGFFHTDRPGRVSMALDIIEEFRSIIIDKFCLSLINLNEINKHHFEMKENGASLLNKKGREIVLGKWKEKEDEEIYHYYLEEKIKIGLLAHVQAQLLNSYIQEEIPSYPPYMQKG